MSIVVSCKCGKRFKAKDSLAGKRVRCPGCKQPVRVGGGEDSAAAVAAGAPAKKGKNSPGRPDVNEEAALLRFEAAQKKKQMDAEAEAAYRDEQNKLIESYDQLVGRTKPKKKDGEETPAKKGQFTEGPIKKPTIFTKIADLFGVIFANLFVRYLIIAALLGGAAYGSVMLVQFLTTYMKQETTPTTSKDDQIKELEKQCRQAILDGNISRARRLLDDILKIDATRERHRNYIDLNNQLKRAMEKRR